MSDINQNITLKVILQKIIKKVSIKTIKKIIARVLWLNLSNLLFRSLTQPGKKLLYIN
jgi:hypothetical protein